MKQDVYSVSSLVHYVKKTLDNDINIQSVLIKGEISNFTNHRSGHWYFTLKDAKAKLSCVMFSSYASRSSILLKEGMKVIVSASLSMYEAGGSIQLYVTAVQIDGLGDLFLQLEQTKEKLLSEGLFAKEHKKPLPSFPMNIGIVTAKTGAAIHDMLATIARRWPLCEVRVYPSLVQGSGASENLIHNLQLADEEHHDVILLARGGGAIEDLWCFNEEGLARFVYQMKTVIVTGVGHESDTTLVDYVSDARAATPTAAAELITPDIVEVLMSVDGYKLQMQRRMKHRLQIERQQLKPLAQHRYIKDPLSYIRESQMKLAMHVHELGVVDKQIHTWNEELRHKIHQLATLAQSTKQKNAELVVEKNNQLNTCLQNYRTNATTQLKEQIHLLDAYSPLKILGRGYAVAYHEEHIIKSIQDIHEQDEIKMRLHDGIVHALISKKEEL